MWVLGTEKYLQFLIPSEPRTQYTESTFSTLHFLSFTEEIAVKAGSYLQTYAKSHGVEIADALIAASAFNAQAKLFTLNKKHYPMSDIEFL